MRAVRPLIDTALVVLAAARLTRLLTEDHLGRWYFRGPIEAWGDRHEVAAFGDAEADGDVERLAAYDESRPWTWQKRLSEGASCRWCVGFWIGGLVLTGDVLTRTTAFGWARPLYRFGLSVLALNSVANWVGERTGTLS